MSARDEVKKRSRDMCEARIAIVCTVRAEHMHHRKLRSQGGKDTADNLIALCSKCHDYIHANPAWSKAEGFIIPIGIAS